MCRPMWRTMSSRVSRSDTPLASRMAIAFDRRPAVAVVETLLQQQEVGVGALRAAAGHVDEDSPVPHLHREGVEIVAAPRKAATARHVVAVPVPVAGEDASAGDPPSEGVAHVGTLVVSGVNAALDVEQGDAAPLADPDGLGASRL